MPYEHIFFDLDSTLWDLEKNSHETLSELIDKYDLKRYEYFSADEFIVSFRIINEELWNAYRKDLVDRQALRVGRFIKALQKFSIEDEALVQKMSSDYSSIAPYKNNLLPYAIETLDYLKSKYHLHIITNGFEDIQDIKMKSSGLYDYFKEIITADNSGHKKPDPRIFNFALEKTKADMQKSIMIGDSLEVDVLGAKAMGMESVYFNPNKLPHTHQLKHEIACLSELKKIL